MKESIDWIARLRTTATFAVIILHVSALILDKYGEVSEEIWLIGNFYDSSVRFCVPIFFMLSGALLLDRDYKLSIFFKKRFFRIIPPLIFWSLVYIFYGVFVVSESNIVLFDLLKKIIRNLLNGSKYHLWFVYTLLGLYLFVPILRKWIKHATKTDIHYFLIIWLATTVYSIPYFKMYLPDIYLVNFSGYIGYLVLGYYLAKKEIKNKFVPLACILIGIGITFFGTYYLTKINGVFSSDFYGYLSLNVILSATGVFLLFKNLKIKNQNIEKAFSFFSKHSFGIYLVHVLVLILLNNIGINWKFMNPIVSIPVTAGICFLLSGLIIYLLRKIKYVEYISG